MRVIAWRAPVAPRHPLIRAFGRVLRGRAEFLKKCGKMREKWDIGGGILAVNQRFAGSPSRAKPQAVGGITMVGG